MKFFACVLLAVAASAAPEADPALVYGTHGLYGGYGLGYGGVYGGYAGLGGLGYAGHGLTYAAPVITHAVPTVGAVASIGATPVAVGGYKAVAGDNGELKGAVHEVPAVVGAPLLATQESAGGVSLTTGTGVYAVTGHTLHHALGKREADAEADPALLYGGYAGHLGYGLGYRYGGLYNHGVYAAAPVVTKTVAAPVVSTVYGGLAHGLTTYGHGLHGLGYGYGLGYGHGLYGYRHAVAAPVAVKSVEKREAAAEPEADAYYGYRTYGGYGHGYGYGGYGHGYGYGHRLGYYGGYGHHGYSGYYGWGK
jgi:hypothetical protein